MTRRRRRVVATVVGVVGVLVTSFAVRAPSFGSADRMPSLHGTPDWYLSADERYGRTNADNLAWVASGRIPGSTTGYEAMVRDALLDLRRLSTPQGAVAAGPSGGWAFDWPRDTAFVAVALDRAGHRSDALNVLGFLAPLQQRDGGFAARYRLDGSGVPDDRPRQDDAAGWLLWALDEVSADDPYAAAVAPAALRRAHEPLPATAPEGALDPSLVTMARRALAQLLSITHDGTQLPPVTPDYWEVAQSQVSLGEVAPMVAGFDNAAMLFARLGDAGRCAAARSAATRAGALVVEKFGPTYQRYGSSGGLDASVAMLMPAFVSSVPVLGWGRGGSGPQVLAGWKGYQDNALRQGGGLAPGAWWYHVDESWTPETALVAYTAAASGRTAIARRWMDWLDAHRAPWGSLPEKVLADGKPAGAAPLAWTAALVVLTASELDRHPGPTRP